MCLYIILKLTTMVYAGAFEDLEHAKSSLVKAYQAAGQTVTFSNQGVNTLATIGNGEAYVIRQITPARQITSLEGVQN